MNILVTGGLGFIGSHFIKYILTRSGNEEIDLYNIDFMGHGSSPGNLSEVEKDPRYFFVKSDINNISKVQNDIPKPDIVVNIAAESHVDRSISDPRPFIRSNYQGGFELLEYVRKNDIPKYIQISTDEVYGEAGYGYSFRESDPLNPSNPYSASKAAADLLVKSFHRTYGLNLMISRCTNNYGPNQFPEKLIPKTIIRILEGQPVLLYGTGKQSRDWIYVTDHVRAIQEIMKKGKSGEIYNVSSSHNLTNIEVVHKISDRVEKKTDKKAQVGYTADRPGHDNRYSLDTTKISSELGWIPETDFDEGLDKTVEWYLQNKPWWSSLRTSSVTDQGPWIARAKGQVTNTL